MKEDSIRPITQKLTFQLRRRPGKTDLKIDSFSSFFGEGSQFRNTLT